MKMSFPYILMSIKKSGKEIHLKQFLSFLNVKYSSNLSTNQETDEEGFRILNLKQTRATRQVRKVRDTTPVLPPRATRMPIDQKWSDVWPGPRTFHPASVPLPIRQGVNNLGPAPDKWANAELMKIPNFLHLTPDAIKLHCEALKQFCTQWPDKLTDEKVNEHFPLEVISSDYCHSSPTIRDPLARIVTIKFPLSKLELDKHAKDKFLRLVGDRYDESTGLVTIVTDKCPLKKQNYDYALYLMTALYHESWITEPWEEERLDEDLEYYDWDNSKSKENVMALLNQNKENDQSAETKKENYKNAIVAIFDEGENEYNWEKYNEAALNIIFPEKT